MIDVPNSLGNVLFLGVCIPAVFVTHNVSNFVNTGQGCFGVQEGQSAPSGQEVQGSSGVLVSHGIFELSDGERMVKSGISWVVTQTERLGIFWVLEQVDDNWSTVSVVMGQMGGQFIGQSVVLSQSGSQRDLVVLCTNDFEVFGGTWLWVLGLQLRSAVDGLGDNFLSHFSISGPFTSGDGDQAVWRLEDQVASNKSLSGLHVLASDRGWVSDQRSDTTPGTQDVFSLDLEFNIVLQLFQNVVDLKLRSNRVLWNSIQRNVGGSSKNLALPWKEEHDSTVRGRSI
ncbi:hypothetical protein OGAPHI_006310 [Ogataea philodendri]|uniref:Uncharacterized protein n=1 Tax=Ogataea philodendri TaxID=1378263 RepID=A0A9P8NZY9_9ASCO|nr:uncharacterized protein OGAPHI_006310 [Ogataea philodendri]KAH3662129.1 hypothetical protein OGAPHI_006310 [Ogataea philodendri]